MSRVAVGSNWSSNFTTVICVQNVGVRWGRDFSCARVVAQGVRWVSLVRTVVSVFFVARAGEK